MAETTMSSKGQVVIPAEIRRTLGVARSTRFNVEVRQGCIVLRPIAGDEWRSLEGSIGGASLTAWLERERRRERKREG